MDRFGGATSKGTSSHLTGSSAWSRARGGGREDYLESPRIARWGRLLHHTSRAPPRSVVNIMAREVRCEVLTGFQCQVQVGFPF